MANDNGSRIRADDVTKQNSSNDKEIWNEDREVTLLAEIVGGYKLVRDNGISDADLNPYVMVNLGDRCIHRSKAAAEGGPNPVWTVSTRTFFLIQATLKEIVENSLQITVISKQKDPLQFTTLQICFLGKATIRLAHVLQNHCNEERLDVELQDGEIPTGLSRGILTLRFRFATPSDKHFLNLLQKGPKLLRQKSTRHLENVSSETVTKVVRKPLLITEESEADMAGESLLNVFSNAFHAKSYFDKKVGQTKILVKPFPDPDRVQQTTYLTQKQLFEETMKPSRQWIKAGSGKLGRLYLEILSCHGLPNTDVGEAMGNVTDAFICAVFEDAMVQTPVIDDELSPHWLPWTQRAFVFSMMHPASMLYLGCFDFDLGIGKHEAIGRVAVNISNLQRDTDYTLRYNLYPSSNVTDRIAFGSITIRLRVEYNDEKEALLAALRPRPKFHINVQKEKTLAVLHYTCFGVYGDTNEQTFDVTVMRSYINEILEYKRAISYCMGDAARSLIFWRGQVSVFNIMVPLHSFLFFCGASMLIERPYLAPSFSLLSIAWLMLAAQTHRRQHPSPLNRCHSFRHFIEILKNGQSSRTIDFIEPNQGAGEADSYEKSWKERLENDEKIAAQQAELQQKLLDIGDESIHTKLTGGIPLDILVRLTRYQGILGRLCLKFRLIKIIVTWEESIMSFWITACCLAGGIVSLFLPWSFIIPWTSRFFVYGLLGPHMKLVDLWLHDQGQDDATLKQAMENFHRESHSARARHQEAVKLRDLKSLAFGQYITLIPSHNLNRHYDYPLSCSSARVHEKSELMFTPAGIPGQQFFGVILPRTEDDQKEFESEYRQIQNCYSGLVKSLRAMTAAEEQSLEDEKEDVCTEVGYELITYSDDKGHIDSKQKRLRVSANSQLSIYPQSNVAILDKGMRATNCRRRSSTFRGGVELIEFNQAEKQDEYPKKLQIGEKEPLLFDQEMKLAIFQTSTNEEEHSRLHYVKKTPTWPIAQSEPPISSLAANLSSFDEEREAGEVEIVLRVPERDEVPLSDDDDDDDTTTDDFEDDGTIRYDKLPKNVDAKSDVNDDSSILYHFLPTTRSVDSSEGDRVSLTCKNEQDNGAETTELQKMEANQTLNDGTQTCTS